MNTIGSKTRAFLLSLGWLAWGQASFAQSNCIRAQGDETDALAGAGTAGVITKGGILNGTTITVYPPAFVVTPDPNFVAYTSEKTITTVNGQLKTSIVYLYNFVTGVWSAVGSINSGASTGIFAGASGTLYFNGTTVGGTTFPSQIAGEVCLAK
jgi:hypothetical protein